MSDYKDERLPVLFHSNHCDVIYHMTLNSDTQIFTFGEDYSRYFPLLNLPPLCARQMIAYTLDGAPYMGESFAINTSVLPLLYKLVYIMRRVQISPKKLDDPRDNQRTYLHDIDLAESLLLAVVAGVEHEVWGDVKEGRIVRKYHLDRALQDWLGSGSHVSIPHIHLLLDNMIRGGEDAVNRFLNSEFTRKAEYLTTVRNYLRARATRPGFLRGDTVCINRYRRYAGYLLFDGHRIIDPFDNQQHPMCAITEFPLHYWYQRTIRGSFANMVNIDINAFHIGHGIYNDLRPFLREACRNSGIAISPTNKIASFALWLCGDNHNSIILIEYNPKDNPTFDDLRNWILVSRKMWVADEHHNLICGNTYNPCILAMLLAPLRECYRTRSLTIARCKTFPPVLNSIISEYTRDYF